MSTPTQAPPEPPVYAAAPPVRPWFKKKRFMLPALAVVFYSMGTATGSGSAPVATPTPAVTVTVPGPAPAAVIKTVTVAGPAPAAKVVTKRVNVAPAECGTALDLAAKFVIAVSEEHTAMGEAFSQAGDDGDIVAMAASITAAMKTVTDTTADISGPMSDATSVCRAAVK